MLIYWAGDIWNTLTILLTLNLTINFLKVDGEEAGFTESVTYP